MRARSSVSSHGTLNPFDGWTNKFVFPPHYNSYLYDYKLSYTKSTLLMMVFIFCGHDLMKSL
jgi:S-adenosylmethionine:tRNA ribosyltransferase-isomerase